MALLRLSREVFLRSVLDFGGKGIKTNVLESAVYKTCVHNISLTSNPKIKDQKVDDKWR